MSNSATNWKWVNEWPFDPPLPDHLFVDIGGGIPLFLHFDKPVTAPDRKLLWIGTGERARFYLEEQPNAAYCHFHRFKAPTPDAGHGGPPGAEGYWLTHVAVSPLEMMGMKFEPGVSFNFMPTKPPGTSPEAKLRPLPASATGWKWNVEWPFDAPLPEHEWLDLGNGKMLFLHYDKPVSASGKKLLFVGVGIRGRFLRGEEPGPAFVHFHRLNAPTPDAGHGGPPGAEGYWLTHVAVSSFEMMGMKFEPGVAFDFMPTVPEPSGTTTPSRRPGTATSGITATPSPAPPPPGATRGATPVVTATPTAAGAGPLPNLPLTPGNPVRGQRLFGTAGCNGCHTVRGVGGNVGPDLSAVAQRAPGRAASQKLERPELYLVQSLVYPGAYLVEGFKPDMPDWKQLQLKERDVSDLVAYLMTLEEE